MKFILPLILVLNAIAFFNVGVNGLVSSKTTEVKLKAFADKLFDNLIVSKDQVANKTRVTELKTVFDKIKQNPIRLFDLMITLKNNKALNEEAMKIIDFSQFDQCIQMLIDLILQRLEYWMQSTTTSAPTGTTAVTVTLTGTGTGTGTASTTTTAAITGTTSTVSGTTSTATGTTSTATASQTSTVSTSTTTTILYTISPILTDTVLIDPLYCNNFTISNCSLAPVGQSLNLIPFICKSLCSCQGAISCSNNGSPVLNSSGSCRCLCNPGYYGTNCQTKDREFCQLSLKPSCTDPFISTACPTLCSS